MAPNSFRAIIVGGGPVGLAVANMLAKADIDFVVLERHHEIVAETGASIMLWPHGTRIFDQLGLMGLAEERYPYIPLHSRRTMTLDGRTIRETPIFDLWEENHGYPCANFPRKHLTGLLYAGLGPQHQSKVRTRAAIRAIETDVHRPDRVAVHLRDGTVERGNLVIGADGVHSQTRALMRGLARDKEEEEEEKGGDAMTSPFQVLYGTAAYVAGMPTGTFFETHGRGVSSQIMADARLDRMHFAVFRKRPVPAQSKAGDGDGVEEGEEEEEEEEQYHHYHRYSEAETRAFVEDVGDVMVMPGLTARELWRHCRWTRLVDQYEGLAGRWHWGGRVVLVGDSAAQMTSAAGLGYNNALQSAVVLVNKIHGVVVGSEGEAGKGMSRVAAMERALAEYEALRREESKVICDMSASMVRGNLWESWVRWFLGEWLMPKLVRDETLLWMLGRRMISKGRILNFAKTESKQGAMPWVYL
ncbi:FAD/NAD(P)-binding domain-containing protein [Xylariaceae sp. FL0016]|nr:FAD/NAD(P)-binding domain-containing protein [Xylariaceae sp. FL0016]